MTIVDYRGLIARADSALDQRVGARYLVQSVRRSEFQDTTVCLAEETETGAAVELTVLSGDLARNDDLLAALGAHVGSMRSVSSHRGMAKLYEVERRDAGTAVLVAEHPTGPTLREVLRRERRLEPERAVWLAIQMAEVLERVHSVGLVHGGLRPDNVVLTAPGETVVLTQVGVGWLLSQRTASPAPATASPAGVAYRAPEQASGTATERSDVYAVGAILYEMLAGAPPTGPARRGVNALRAQRPEITPSLERIIMRTLDPLPEARQQDASVLCNDLWDERNGPVHPYSPEKAKPSGTGRGSGPKQGARSRRFIALGALAAVGVLGAWLVSPRIPVVSLPGSPLAPSAPGATEPRADLPAGAPTMARPGARVEGPSGPAPSAREVPAPRPPASSPQARRVRETLAAGPSSPAAGQRPVRAPSASPELATSQKEIRSPRPSASREDAVSGRGSPSAVLPPEPSAPWAASPLEPSRPATSGRPPARETAEDPGAIIDWLLSEGTRQRH